MRSRMWSYTRVTFFSWKSVTARCGAHLICKVPVSIPINTIN
jgi:hypothetical protein